MRALFIDEEARAKVQRVVEYASQPEHWYCPGLDAVAGDNPNYTCELNTYRCVFTYTVGDRAIGTPWRHLSISVPSKDYPNPAAAFTIAEMFGFTGWDGKTINRMPDDWIMDVNRAEHCVMLAQKVPKVS